MISRFPSVCLLGLAFLFGLFPGLLQALPRTWDGGGANALASTPANWVEDTAPVAGDDIILNTTSHKNMTWDLGVDAGSWTQAEYTGTVTIATVCGASGFTNSTLPELHHQQWRVDTYSQSRSGLRDQPAQCDNRRRSYRGGERGD